jgi:hypothetical protein
MVVADTLAALQTVAVELAGVAACDVAGIGARASDVAARPIAAHATVLLAVTVAAGAVAVIVVIASEAHEQQRKKPETRQPNKRAGHRADSGRVRVFRVKASERLTAASAAE